MKDPFITKITICSFAEMFFMIVLIYALFHYYVGLESGDFLINAVCNAIVIIFCVILLVALGVLQLVLKRKRRAFLIQNDEP